MMSHCCNFARHTNRTFSMYSGTVRIPAFVDMHVHLREPGYSYKETIFSGTRAAQKAGYSDLFTMPNLNPVPDSLPHLQEQLDIIARDAAVRVHPYASITIGQKGKGELVDFGQLAPCVAGFSDDGKGVQDEGLMREAMVRCKAVDSIIVAHCEVDALLNGGYIHDGNYAREHNHKGISSESEWREIERDIRLVEETGCRFHVCHISTRESVELVRQAKRKGMPVTCETAPHYLLLCDENLREDGHWKMNPPLRSRTDRDALIEGIQDGTIDVIATDHAPHSAEEKNKGLEKSAFGIVGLETAFPLLYTYLIRKDIITLNRLVELMALRPREIMRMGEPKDFITVDLDARYTIDSSQFLSKGKATPFDGWEVYGKVIETAV
ncbi:MAG: dihydroorotase [Paludibacteraceae bacterium]|nr:dihydroorotase [Paludibacteraceae bacterium]